MEKHFVVSIPGQEVEVPDLNLVSDNASFAVDRALSEFLRMRGTDRGIIPPGNPADIKSSASVAPAGVILPSGSADARVRIRNFRAVIGSSAFGGGSDPLIARQGIRSGVYTANEALQFAVQPAGANRIDLIYARVDVPVPDAPVTRYVKDASDAVSAQAIAVTESANVTVGVVQGIPTAPGAALSRPALPADTGSSYYITLGYVFCPALFTLTTSVNSSNIQEAFPPLTVAPEAGASRLLPASINARSDMVFASPPGAGFPLRHRGFVPPSVAGLESRLLALRLGASTDSTINTTAGITTVLDTSIDWRYRIFRMLIAPTPLANSFAWDSQSATSPFNPSSVFDPNTNPVWVMGESFRVTSGPYNIVQLKPDRFPLFPAGAQLNLAVDSGNGALVITPSGTVITGLNLLIWIEATGFYPNF